ncbi:hypothetical protein Poli38472_004911 [Pythium oligandrum]|uniref:Uncharacterized protein n=1 Tax=Pythium oligandrum TaxID=41045 RepID=A0A8K1CAY6_PYTOL|nr:hypothetical protein Poli38472_004911 [Pythium oligandrum]|eukprot:TMW59842.1 hypothetical protein Poli38472_004911 [Pythium oligandrum]
MNWLELGRDEDAAATIDAALAMIDAMGDSVEDAPASMGSGSPGVDENATTTEDSDDAPAPDSTVSFKPSGKPKRSVNKSRNRQKEEMEYLRGRVREMEATLVTLKKRRRVTQGPSSVTTVSSVWKDMMEQHKQQRQFVELENAKLRSMLKAQVKVGKDLMRLLQNSEHDTHYLQAPAVVPRPMIMNDDQLIARLEELYTQSDSVFASSLFDKPGKTTFRDMQMFEEDPETTFIHSVFMWTLPFSTRRVSDAMWQALIGLMKKKDSGYRLDTTNDTAFSVFRSPFQIVKVMSGEVFGKTGVRRFPMGDLGSSTTFALNVSAEVIKMVPLTTDEVHFQEDSWVRIISAPHDDIEVSGLELTQIQFCRQTHLRVRSDRISSGRLKIGMLTDFVLAQIEREYAWLQEAIESLLLTSRPSLTN